MYFGCYFTGASDRDQPGRGQDSRQCNCLPVCMGHHDPWGRDSAAWWAAVGSPGLVFATCCCSATSSTCRHSSCSYMLFICIMYDYFVNTWSTFHSLTELETDHAVIACVKSIPLSCFPQPCEYHSWGKRSFSKKPTRHSLSWSSSMAIR